VASENVELVRSIYGAWERGDFSSTDWADPKIEYVHVDGPLPGRWTGTADMATAWRSWLAAWEEFRVVAVEYCELDDERVLVLNNQGGRGKASGLDLALAPPEGASLFVIADGKVKTLLAYFAREQALADLGLTAEPD
jgi:hypothetical protein